jgi:OOP family OmpA-OmpF porin
MKQTTLAVSLCGILTLVTNVTALAADDITITRPEHSMASRLYLGASFGSAQYDNADDSSAAFSLFGGYHLNEVLALDLSYNDLGKAENGGVKTEASAFSLGVLGKLPLKNDLTLFGKVGLSSWDLDITPGPSDSDIDVSYGLGADYDISGTTAVRFGVDFYSLNGANNIDEDISVFSIGFVYKP